MFYHFEFVKSSSPKLMNYKRGTLPSWIQLQKNECVSDKSSVKGTDELSRTQWQSQLNRKVPVCHRRHSCCNVKFNLLNFNSSEVLFCTFSPSAQLWIHVPVYMSSNICVWFYWFYITCLPPQRNFRLCIDLNVCCTERTVSNFRSY